MLEAVTLEFLAQVGRDLVRSGDSMHVIATGITGRIALLPCSSWHWEGDAHPRHMDSPRNSLRAFDFNHSTLAQGSSCIREMGFYPGPAIYRYRAFELSAYHGSAAIRS